MTASSSGSPPRACTSSIILRVMTFEPPPLIIILWGFKGHNAVTRTRTRGGEPGDEAINIMVICTHIIVDYMINISRGK